jgi:hypothetical protein
MEKALVEPSKRPRPDIGDSLQPLSLHDLELSSLSSSRPLPWNLAIALMASYCLRLRRSNKIILLIPRRFFFYIFGQGRKPPIFRVERREIAINYVTQMQFRRKLRVEAHFLVSPKPLRKDGRGVFLRAEGEGEGGKGEFED